MNVSGILTDASRRFSELSTGITVTLLVVAMLRIRCAKGESPKGPSTRMRHSSSIGLTRITSISWLRRGGGSTLLGRERDITTKRVDIYIVTEDLCIERNSTLKLHRDRSDGNFLEILSAARRARFLDAGPHANAKHDA